MNRGLSTIDEPGLATIIQGYHDVTERLMRSHELLKGEVCRLRDELHEKNEQLQRKVDANHGPGRIWGERWPSGARSMSHANFTAPQWQLPCRV